ncbi:MAG: hypothetical protein PHU53_05430 [Thermoplasmata archaeon]|nr:hypothetical protein [Thermoplasmata archaeon]
MSKMIAVIAVVVVAVIVAAAVGYYVLQGEDEQTELTVSFNGSEYTYDEMLEEFGTMTVDDTEGISLSAIVNDTGVENPETKTFVLKADDYAMAVNWTLLQSGILTLVEDVDEDSGNETAYLMTLFPGMPGAYKVKYLTDIETAELSPIVCNGLEFYLDYMPRKVNEKTVTYNDTYSPTGWSLSDIVNYTDLADPETHNYTIVGYDAADEEPWYNKTVTWDGMLGGVLVEEDVRTAFDESTEFARSGYRVRNVIEIIVE